jgi:hypothetical protein
MRQLKPHIPVVIGYTLFALLLMAPVLPQFASAIPGGAVADVDGWQNVWNFWWSAQAFQNGQNPFVTDLLFYPAGADLHLQPVGWSNLFLALPVSALWGPVAGYNFALILGIILSGLGAYALALHVGAGRLAAALAGLLYMASPYHLTRIYDGQLELAAIQWLPIYVLFLLRTLESRVHAREQSGRRARRPYSWDALIAGVALAIVGYTSLYYLLMLALLSPLVVLLWARNRAAYRRAALVALTAGVLMLPVLGPAVQTARNAEVIGANPEEAQARSTNLLDVVLPSYLHPLWGEALFEQVSATWHNYSGDWNAALGYGVLILALIGSRRAWAQAWRWWIVASLGLLFALGPELQIGPWNSGLPMPYALFDSVPGLSLGRRPHLFVVLITLALVPLTALGWQALLQARGGCIAAIALAALLVFELTPRPWPLLPYAVHPIFTTLAADTGALLEVPPARYKYSVPQVAQTVHGRPIFGGYLARPPLYDWINEAPVLRELWQMRSERGRPLIAGSSTPAAALRSYGLRDLVLRPPLIAPDRAPEIATILAEALPGVAPTFADAEVEVYRIPDDPLLPFAGLVGDGWHREEAADGRAFRWMRATGAITLVNPTDTPVVLRLMLRLQSYNSPRPLSFSLNGAPFGTQQIGVGEANVYLWMRLEPGQHRLELSAPAESEGGRPGARLLSVVLLESRIDVMDPDASADCADCADR